METTYKVSSHSLLPTNRLISPHSQRRLALYIPSIPLGGLGKLGELSSEHMKDLQCVQMRRSGVRVAKADREEFQVDFGRGDGEEDSEDVVYAGIGVDDQLARGDIGGHCDDVMLMYVYATLGMSRCCMGQMRVDAIARRNMWKTEESTGMILSYYTARFQGPSRTGAVVQGAEGLQGVLAGSVLFL